MSDPLELFNQGALFEAVEAAKECVRENPSDPDVRWTLITLFGFAGDLERAEQHLQTVLRQAPDLAADVLLHRNLIRGELARRQVFADGRVPGFTESPPERLQMVLKGLLALRENQLEQAAAAFEQAIATSGQLKGECNDQKFSAFRDQDDRSATFMEVITANGDYYWVPWEELHEVEFSPVEDPRDVLWRPASLVTRDHEGYSAYVPGLYVDSYLSDDESIQCGRAIDWDRSQDRINLGRGLRMFACEDAPDVHFLDVNRLRFTSSP